MLSKLILWSGGIILLVGITILLIQANGFGLGIVFVGILVGTVTIVFVGIDEFNKGSQDG